jgi:hypothetical protein
MEQDNSVRLDEAAAGQRVRISRVNHGEVSVLNYWANTALFRGGY